MSAGTFDFVDDYRLMQGDTWRFSVRICTDDASTVGRDLTGLIPRMQVRKSEKKTSPLFITFGLAAEPLTGITIRGNQALSSDAGWLDFYASSADTADIFNNEGETFFYDIQLATGATPPDVETWLEGLFYVDPEVTVTA